MENNYNYQQEPQYSQAPYQQGYPMYTQPDESGLFSENKSLRKNGMSARVTLGDWLRLDCLSFLCLIPVLGTIAYLVIYFIIAFSGKTAASIKTRVQANLIWSAIVLAVYIVLIVILFTVAQPLFEELFAYYY